MSLQGPHHSAQKSTRTGSEAAPISSSNVASVIAVISLDMSLRHLSLGGQTSSCSPFNHPLQPRPSVAHSTRAAPRAREPARTTPYCGPSSGPAPCSWLSKPAFGINCCHAAGPGCGNGLAVPVVDQVTGCEHPVDAGRRGPVTGEDVTLFVNLELTSQDVAARDMPDRNEQAGDDPAPVPHRSGRPGA